MKIVSLLIASCLCACGQGYVRFVAPSHIASMNNPPQAPAIASGPSVTATNQASATVGWTTDIATTNDWVYYSTDTSYSLNTNSTAGGTSHSLSILGLTAGTTYNYKVESWANGLSVTSSPAAFATPSALCASNYVYGDVIGSYSVGDSSDEVYFASKFTAAANAAGVCKISLYGHRSGTSPNQFQLQLRSDNAGAPGSVLAQSDWVNPALWDTGDALHEITMTNSAALTSGTVYWVGWSASGYSGSHYCVFWGGNNSTGSVQRSANGSSWAEFSTRQMYAYIQSQ